jgi:hypothetical protein
MRRTEYRGSSETLGYCWVSHIYRDNADSSSDFIVFVFELRSTEGSINADQLEIEYESRIIRTS